MKKIFLLLGTGFLGIGVISCSFFEDQGVKKEIGEASKLIFLIKELNSGRTNEAKQLLNLELNTRIVSIAQSLDRSDEETRRVATNLFSKIADERRKFPVSNYYQDTNYAVASELVSNVLEKASNK